MKKHFIAAALLLSLSGFAFAQTVVTVNGTKIDSKEIDNQVSMLVKESNNQIQDSPQLRKEITNRLVIKTLLIQAAIKQRLDKDPAYLDMVKKAEERLRELGEDKKPGFNTKWADYKGDLLTKAYMDNVIKNNPVKPEDIQLAYDKWVKYYSGTQEVQLGEIITKDAASANQAIAALNAKKDFRAVAKQYTVDEAGRQNGGIAKNYINLKDLQENAQPVFDAIKNLKKGQFTATPVQIQPNNSINVIFYVNDIRPMKIRSQKEAEPALARGLQNAIVNSAIEQLYKNANIKY